MDVSNFYNTAIQLVTEAVKKDDEKKYKEAVDLYVRALDYFMSGMKCTCLRGFQMQPRLPIAEAHRCS